MDISPQWIMVSIAILSHMFATVWWASRAVTKLESLSQAVIKMDRELEKRDAQITAIWKKIDEMREKQIKLESEIGR